MATDEAHSPADHVVTLAHRMHFNADVHGTRCLQEAARCAVKAEHDVCGIVNDDELLFFRQCDNLFKELGRRRFSGRRIRIVQNQQLSSRPNVVRDRIQIGQKVVFL